ncbi:MAG: hypothetical protein IIC29_08630, partial [Chloroflexi bacterium]|nr:hypothetical protein [Chloroflexota bacterium]
MAATSRLDILIRAKDQASKALAGVNKQVGGLQKSFSAARGPMIAIAGAATAAVLQFGRLGDEVQKMSLRTGFSVESLGELRFAMEQAGTSIQGFEVGVRRMAGFIEDARDGLATSTDAMDKLGLSMDDLAGKSPEDAFFILADAIADVDDSITKAALAQDVFGRSGTQLLPLLEEGAAGMAALRQEARDLGIVMDQETANKAAKMQDAINSAKQSMNGLAITVGQVLAPAITLIAKVFSTLPAPLRAAAVAAGVFFLAMKVGLISLRQAIISTGIGALLIAVGVLAGKFGLLGSASSDATKEIDRFKQAVDETAEVVEEATEKIIALQDAIFTGAGTFTAGGTIAALVTGEMKLATREAKIARESMREFEAEVAVISPRAARFLGDIARAGAEIAERIRLGNIVISTSTEDTVVNLKSKWVAFHELRA